MYVLSMEKGYAQIELDDYGQPVLNEYENGPLCKMKIAKEIIGVHIIPIGQIVIDRYNENLRSYLDNGGTVREHLKLHESGKIKLIAPYNPLWFYPEEKYEELDLTDFDLPYIPVCYIPYMGETTPVFSVSELSELYFYDLYRVKSAGKKIRVCEDCGKAFFAKTCDVRCNDCRVAGMGGKKSYNNMKNNPSSAMIKKLNDRTKPGKRKGSEDPAYRTKYYLVLQDRIREARDNLEGEKLELEINRLSKLDDAYWKLFKFCSSDRCFMTNEQLKTWEKEKYSILTQDDPEQWLSEWEEKAGL